jgi:ubiquinone/menaquinone biosynthesis C-methylase UbiE
MTWSETFDQAAGAYDDPSLRFFDLGARALIDAAGLREGWRVLDVATGTGKVAGQVARAVGAAGRVTGIDASAQMLRRARDNTEGSRVRLVRMDATRLGFRDRSFDAVTCGFGITFFRPAIAAAREMARVLDPGGRVAMCTPAHDAFQPQLGRFFDALEAAGLPRPEREETPASLDRPEHLAALLRRAGFSRIELVRQPITYDLDVPGDFWAVVAGTAWRGALRTLPPETVDAIHEDLTTRLRTEGTSTLSAPLVVATASIPRRGWGWTPRIPRLSRRQRR